jgi:Mrp family chromosome partitioning ATPase
VTDASAEQPVRLGPAAANIARSIWHQKELLVLGLVLGLALGWLALPKVLSGGSTYDATVRMKIVEAPADAIVKGTPLFGGGGGSDAPAGASPEVLKDVTIADGVLKQLSRTKGLDVPHDLTPTLLLDRLSVTPLEGTPFVDLSFSDGDPKLAKAAVEQYAIKFAQNRNEFEDRRLERVIKDLEDLAGRLDAQREPGTAPPSTALREKINQARALRIDGEPTIVVGPVIVNTNGPPLSKKVTLGLGLLLGLAVGAGAGLLVETAFRKVVTPADAETASGLPFIAEVRKGGIRRTPLPVIDRPFSPAAEDYRRVGTALERQGLGTDIRVLAICSAEPGDGRTMLAANLAHSLARQGREVVLVSSDLRRPEVERLLGLGHGPGLAEALQDDPIPAIAMLVSINDHLLVLPAGMPSRHPGELLASRRLLETIQTLRQMGIIILDTPPAAHSADAITLSSVADATLFVAKSGATRMRSLHEATSGLRRDRIRQLGLVLVGTSSPLLRSLSSRGDLRDQPDAELEELEPMTQPRQLQFNPRPLPPAPEPVGNGNGTNADPEQAAEVADLNAKERNRRAAE